MAKLPKFLEIKEDDTEKEKKKKKFLLVLFVVLLVLVVAGGVVGIIFGVKSCNGSKGGSTSNNTSDTSSNSDVTSESEPSEDGFIIYALNGDGNSYKVTGLKDTHPTEIVIPNTYKGKSVTKIGEYAFRDTTDVTSFVLPGTITDIEESAFFNCTSLTSINLPEGITSINNSTFLFCYSLTEINIPSSVSIIKDSAFYECKSLETVTFAPESNLETIEVCAFYLCESLKNVQLPETVKNIEMSAFLECHSSLYTEYKNAYYFGTPSKPYWLLEKVLDDSVTTFEIHEDCKAIDYEVFSGCDSLISINIPSHVECIYSQAFSGCDSLSSVSFELPTSLTQLDSGVFHNCSSLTEFTVPSTVTTMGERLFAYTGLTNLVFENEFTELPEDIIGACWDLESITLPASLSVIHASDFENSESLQTINFGGTIAEWNSIDKEPEWDKKTIHPLTVHCKDGDVVIA